jgi:predicted Zn-dependent protease
VNQLGRWISLQSARPQLPWSFAVLDDAGYNAFAAPGGYVFVTKRPAGARGRAKPSWPASSHTRSSM